MSGIPLGSEGEGNMEPRTNATYKVEIQSNNDPNQRIVQELTEEEVEGFPQRVNIPLKYPLRIAQMILAALVVALAAAAIAGTIKYEHKLMDASHYACDALALATGAITLITVPVLLFELLPSRKTNEKWKYNYLIVDLVIACLWIASFVSLAVQHANTDCEVFNAHPDFCEIGKGNAAVSAVTFALFLISSWVIFKHL